MESVNKSFDVDGKFREIEKIFEVYKEDGHRGEYEGMAIKIVSGLIDILKEINHESPDKSLVDRVCKFIDEISEKRHAVWGLSRYERNGEILFSFLNELAADKKFVTQIDRIFRSGGGVYPLVNNLSRNPMIKDEFNELFQKLPEEYRDKLSGEIISYQDGDKDYAYPLIGGAPLMGF